MSMTAHLLFGPADPKLPGTKQRHLMDGRPVSGQNYCREHSVRIRLANVETIFAAVNAGKQTISAIEDFTKIGRCTISKGLAELESDKRIKRSKPGKQTFFEVSTAAVTNKAATSSKPVLTTRSKS